MAGEQSTEIFAWRGLCLDYFARAERALGQTLLAANKAGKSEKLRHLAGQRLADLINVIEHEGGTPKQTKALTNAIEAWQNVESQRQFLAHGVSNELADSKGHWAVILDLTSFRSNAASEKRWTITQEEARRFEQNLEAAYKNLSSQLGQFRKRLNP